MDTNFPAIKSSKGDPEDTSQTLSIQRKDSKQKSSNLDDKSISKVSNFKLELGSPSMIRSKKIDRLKPSHRKRASITKSHKSNIQSGFGASVRKETVGDSSTSYSLSVRMVGKKGEDPSHYNYQTNEPAL